MNYYRVKSTASRWFIVETFLAHYSQKWRHMIDVKEEEDGSFTISWDENDPRESILNTWTQEDFTNHIRTYCEELIAKSDDPDNEGFAIEEVLQDIIDQSQEVVNEGEQSGENTTEVVRKDEDDERLPRLFF